jgi:murein DD-endopeptidase MepM/ murein hydrolase activator NlpD
VTRYGHLSSTTVKVGQRVRRGDPIALTGSTGRSTGPHLHYEVLVHQKAVDPLVYILEESKVF